VIPRASTARNSTASSISSASHARMAIRRRTCGGIPRCRNSLPLVFGAGGHEARRHGIDGVPNGPSSGASCFTSPTWRLPRPRPVCRQLWKPTSTEMVTIASDAAFFMPAPRPGEHEHPLRLASTMAAKSPVLPFDWLAADPAQPPRHRPARRSCAALLHDGVDARRIGDATISLYSFTARSRPQPIAASTRRRRGAARRSRADAARSARDDDRLPSKRCPSSGHLVEGGFLEAPDDYR